MSTYQSERVRLLFKMNSVANTRDDFTQKEVDLWRRTDWRFEVGWAFGDTLVDASIYESAKIEIMPDDDREGAALASKTVVADDMTFNVSLEDWQSAAAQQAVFQFDHNETNFDLGGESSKVFYLVCSIRTQSGEWIVAGYATVRVYESGTPKDADYPVQGGNVVPLGATYDGSGNYSLTVTLAKAYNIAFGANESTVTNGNETLTGSGLFTAQANPIVLHGTPNAIVTAVVRGEIYLTADQMDARYFTDRQLITQSGHGFAPKDVVRLNGTTYVKAQANNRANAEAVGIVEWVDGNKFMLVRAGGKLRGVTGLTAGEVYFLSPTTAGLLTTNDTEVTFEVSKPMLLGLDSTSGVVLNYRGVVVEAQSDERVTEEIPTGSVNGTNANFGTAYDYVTGTLEVFINGIRQSRIAGHFTETGDNTFSFSSAPSTGDNIIVSYTRQ